MPTAQLTTLEFARPFFCADVWSAILKYKRDYTKNKLRNVCDYTLKID